MKQGIPYDDTWSDQQYQKEARKARDEDELAAEQFEEDAVEMKFAKDTHFTDMHLRTRHDDDQVRSTRHDYDQVQQRATTTIRFN